jgi:hypothetical protein
LLYVKKHISLKTPTTKIVFKNIHSRNVCSADLEDTIGEEELHIPAVLYNVLASTCSNILNVYVATCFYIKNIYLHRVCLYDPIKLNKQ